MTEKIESVLNERVRPVLRSHQGEIELLGYADGIAQLRFLGACASCPSAYLATAEMVEQELKSAISELRQVVLLQEAPDELLDMARKLMGRKNGA